MPEGQSSSGAYHSVVEAFVASVSQNRNNIAVICGDESLTYNQLHLLSSALAAQLRDLGVKTGDRVGVCSEKRVELAVALLGILKAGAAYIPIDDAYPEARLHQMATDAGIGILLGESAKLTLENVSQINFDNFIKSKKLEAVEDIDRESTAYVMYTSGSTGNPKGVAVPHRAILRLVIDQNFCDLGPDEKILQHSPVAFDASTFEIWGALLNGGQMVILPTEETSLRTIGEAIDKYDISTIWLTAGLFHAIAEERPEDLRPLRQLLTGGDVVSPTHSAKILQLLPDLRLINGYGPTENTTFTCCHTITPDDVVDGAAIPIGAAISGTGVHILDSSLKPVPMGDAGELCASGDGLALGYLNNLELTAEKFVSLENGTTIYRTGDLAKIREDGTVEFLGRIDQQVKIRGFRIELGEIETALLHIEGVQQASVVAEKAGDSADKILLAHYVADRKIDKSTFRQELGKTLPDHCIPAFFNHIDKLPLNTNGKVDRKALPGLKEIIGFDEPATTGPEDSEKIFRVVSEAFAEVLEMPVIPPNINFFDLGASSLQIARIHEKIQAALNTEFPVTDFFHYTTVKELSGHLGNKNDSSKAVHDDTDSDTSDQFIAIVGMAGRFPGAPDIETFWNNLVEGKETISHFTREELEYENATATNSDPDAHYVRSRGIIEGSDHFDARHFGINPREATELDPQHRLMLECAQTALENAGHDPDRFDGKIGLFCGSSQNSYLLNNLCSNPNYARQLAAGYPTTNFNALLGNDKDFLPTRVAYKLNLKGPAVSVQCACSTSLVSVAQACESLRSKTCDMAMAGGISLGHPQKRDYLYTPDGIASRDGHCRTFDADATGTVFGEGVGLVALRRLDDAVADGDNIIAVIRGFALNNDGSEKAGYTAPSIKGQIEVIRDAQKSAKVEADSIGYIETHGTATPLGDPIEVAALNSAFRETTDKKHFCTIGTGKTNFGHLDIAAGVTGLIKTALTVKHGVIPPLLHFRTPNPKINFDDSPFIPATELQEWTSETGPRRAGVSAFGVGGTNVHMILEESPIQQGTVDDSTGYNAASNRGQSSLFPLSASHPDALAQAVTALGNFAANHTGADINSIAYTLQKGRRNYSCRTVLVADSVEELSKVASHHSGKSISAGNYEKVAFMFPGQGSQHPGMAQELYDRETVFRESLDLCADIINNETGVDLIELLFPDDQKKEEMAERLKNTSIAQPAIFAIEYALSQQWKHWGITPACMIGHSIGEFAAACIAGVFTLNDALSLICLRGKLMAGLPGGAMISVRATESEIQPFLSDSINLAAVNGASSCVIAGPYDEADQVLAQKGIESKRLHTSHAFHSSMMEPVVDEFESAVAKLSLRAPEIPILSTVTQAWMTDEDATDPHYWAAHLRKPVHFYGAIQQVWRMTDHALIEVGPGRTLATLAGQNPDRRNAQPSLASLPHPTKQECAWGHMRTSLGNLWCHGLSVDWDVAEERTVKPRKIELPTYRFQRQRYMVEPEQPATTPTPSNYPAQYTLPEQNQTAQTMTQTASKGVEPALKEILAELSGISPEEMDNSAS
ncbi:MAG: amino acid adenylation domain-containing protein, partial [Verrucomicrobiales bacterium]|nr:amino acid adenylation domain-containing protein [Verrucomicrobiales bacterium]